MAEVLDSYTLRLFKKKRPLLLVEEFGSVLDFSDSNHLYNFDKSNKDADRNSLQSDWLQVGKDLQNIVDEYTPTPLKGTNRD